jgi:hypothetical protein
MPVTTNKEEGWIGHRLNRIGIRVWRDKCQLVAKPEGDWVTIGPTRSLPLHVPKNAAELDSIAHDPLLLTAYQLIADNPDSDLAALLSQQIDFDSVLNS